MTYKKLVENMVDYNVYKQVSDASRAFVTVDDIRVAGGKTSPNVYFNCTVKVIQYGAYISNDFRLSGYIGTYGEINICSIMYERFYLENGKTVEKSFFVYGEDLKTFKYNH